MINEDNFRWINKEKLYLKLIMREFNLQEPEIFEFKFIPAEENQTDDCKVIKIFIDEFGWDKLNLVELSSMFRDINFKIYKVMEYDEV